MVAAVIADRRLRTVTNTFMVSLAVSDVLIATVNMPVQLWYITVHSTSLCLVQCVLDGPPVQSSCGTSPCITPHCASSSVSEMDLQSSPAVVHHRAFHLTAPRPVCSRWTSSPVQLWYYVSNEWTLGEMMCKLSRYVQGVVIVNCILTLTGIAVDRSVIIQEQVTQLLYPYVYVCTVSVCTLCNTITFENLHTESLFLVCKYVFAVYGSSSYMKVI